MLDEDCASPECLLFLLTFLVCAGTLWLLHCQLWDLIVCLSKSSPITDVFHRWTPVKMQKHLKSDQWTQDAPELNVELHWKAWDYCVHLISYLFCKKKKKKI